MKKTFSKIFIFLVLACGLAAGGFYYLKSLKYESTDDAFLEAAITPIASRISGQVLRLHVQDNQLVKEGDLLLEIDPRDFEVKVERAKAQVAIAETELTKEMRDLARFQNLHDKRAISDQQLEQITWVVQAKKAALAREQANLKQAELELSYTKITAPKPGKITQKGVQLGGHVSPGQPLMALVSPELWVVANFKESQLEHLKINQEVEIEIDAYPKRKFKGHVDSFQAGSGSRFSLFPPENASGNFIKVVQRVPVKIVFDETLDPHLSIGPGMSVFPKIKIK